MDVIGNNIANVNTVAFKNSQIRFDTLLSQMTRGAAAPTADRGGVNPSQVGMGVRVSSIITNHAQGTLQPSDRETDLAIEGMGYFIVSDGLELYYTRDGSFSRDATGELVNVSGLKLMVWDGMDLAPINIPLGERMVAKPTTTLNFQGNLDVRYEPGESWSFEDYIFDSLGRHYVVQYTFTKEADPNRWSYTVEVVLPEGNETIGTGILQYTEQGALDLENSTITNLSYLPEGAEPLDIQLQFRNTTQVAGLSNLLLSHQDGFAAGELVSFSISQDGTIIGSYTNGMMEVLGQIALASFPNPEGLIQEGGNLYSASANSGEPRIGLPGQEGRGLIRSFSLEMSNADLSYEFTELITASRAFQANTRVITTSDEILVEVINMKR